MAIRGALTGLTGATLSHGGAPMGLTSDHMDLTGGIPPPLRDGDPVTVCLHHFVERGYAPDTVTSLS